MSKDILTQYEKDLTEYWKNWKPGMPCFGKTKEDYEEEEKQTKKKQKVKKSSREIMEDIQFELGLDEEELDDLLIPEEEWDDLDEQ